MMEQNETARLYDQARQIVVRQYEEENGEESWEELDKYKREDLVFTEYMKLIGEIEEC